MSDTQINIQSEETAIEFTQEQVAIEFVQEEVQIEFVQETTQIDFVSENIVLNLTGVPGPPGVGVPVGGTAGQVLAKINGDDYNTEWVDQSGGGGGGASITEITYADMATALQDATLTPGQFYNITDAAGTDLGFICQAVKENEITVNGTGGYLNADFQGEGDYSNVEAGTGVAFGTQKGIWRPGFEAIVIPYTNLAGGSFAVGDTITGGNTGATAVVDSDNGSEVTAYMTSAGVAFDGSEVLDNGNGVTADMNGAAGNPDIALGDVVVWNLLHWQLTDDTLLNGTDPETNTDAYTLLDKATYPETYIEAWDVSEFDFENNWLQRRIDNKGNDIAYSFITSQSGYWGYAFNPILNFQWGNSTWYSVKAIDGLVNDKNTYSSIYANRLYGDAGISENIGGGIYRANVLNEKAFIYQNTLAETASIEENILSPGIGIDANALGLGVLIRANSLSGGRIGANTILENGYIIVNEGSISIINNTLAVGGYISGNKGVGAEVAGNTIGEASGIFDNNIYQAARIADCMLGDGAFIRNCNIGQNIRIENKTISSGFRIAYCEIGVVIDVAETIAENIENKRAIPGFSDIPGTIDITGLTTLDITAAWAQYRGIFNLTSDNATESIDTITNPPTLFPFTLRPAAGLVLTITGTAYAGIGAGQIALKATDYVLDGDKGEYIVLEIDPNGTGCLVEKLVVNGLI